MSDDNRDDNSSNIQDGNETVRGEHAGLIPARNGALRDPKTGKIVAVQPGGLTSAITKETAPIMHKLREQDRINGAYKGLLIAAGLDSGKPNENQRAVEEAIPIFVAAQGRLALNEMAGRASTEAFRAVMQFSGLWPERDKQPDISSVQALGIGFARELCRLLQDNTGFIAENDIIDGEIVGNGNGGGDDDVIVAEFRQELDDNG